MAGKTLVTKEANSTETDRPPQSQAVQLIRPSRGRIDLNWSEIWRYRDLLYFLIWRDVKVSYKQTVMGAAWTILQPIAMMAIFSLFLGRFAGLSGKTGGIPYPLYVYAGLLPWTFFTKTISNSGSSLVSSANLITKVYFPRLIIPLSVMGSGLVDLAVAFVVLLGLILYYGVALTWQLALVPFFLTGTILIAAGVGTLLAALTVAYRDFVAVVPFVLQIWMFVTPVIYPASIIPESWQWVLVLNPMAGLIEGFRSAFLGLPVNWPHTGLSLVLALFLFMFGAAYFRQVERRFADII